MMRAGGSTGCSVAVPILVGAAAFLAALAGIALTRQAGNVASLWLANGVLLAALLSAPGCRWGPLAAGFVVGNAAANVAVGDGPAVALGFGLVNAAEALLGARLAVWAGGSAPRFESVGQVLRFALAVAVAAPLGGATVGAGFVAWVFGAPYPAVWPTWFVGDALGNLTMGPLLVLLVQAVRERRRIGRRDLVAMAWPALVMVGAAAYIFLQTARPLAFLAIPPAIVLTFRAGPLGAALATMIVAVVGGVGTALGRGPMSLGDGTMQDHIRTFQLLVLAQLASTLPLAAILAERRALERRLLTAAFQDALTGLANRAGFHRDLAAAIARADARGGPLSVVLADVDHFKRVNDTHGHEVGDAVLAEVGAALRSAAEPGHVCARLGGEEFVILMPDTPLDRARALSERMREAVVTRLGAGAEDLLPVVTVSAGAAQRIAGESAKHLLSRADRALYDAKRAGRNRVVLAA